MLQIASRLTQLAEHAVGQLRVRSVLSSCLWLVAVATTLGVIGAVLTAGWIQVALLGLAVLPVLLYSVGFVFFMLNDPDKLRSEEYEITRFALEIIEEKGGKVPMAGTSVESIANTYVKTDRQLKGDDR